jgi:hypothetical protein
MLWRSTYLCHLMAVAVSVLTIISILPQYAGAGEPAEGKLVRMKDLALAEGKTEYIIHCQACHGDAGVGDGGMAKILVKQPTDLTQLAKRDNGRFPFWRTFNIIAGDVSVSGHEPFQMPQFWQRFQRQEVLPGYPPAHFRVLALTHYIESLQSQEQAAPK